MRPYPYRPDNPGTLFVDPMTGECVLDSGRVVKYRPDGWAGGWMPTRYVLTVAASLGCRRVFLVGPKPRDTGWLDEPTPGFVPAGHFYQLRDPCGRWADRDGRRVEVRRVASWFGEGAYGTGEAREAMARTHNLLKAATGGRVGVLASPAATGQSLWAATLRDGQCDEQTPDDIADLIRATSPQHREEVLGSCFDGCDEHLPARRGRLVGLSYVDGVFMYAACVRELGTAPVRMLDAREAGQHWDDLPTSARGVKQGRARYEVTVTVPAGWEGPGLLPVKHPNGRNWHYPNRPGVTFTTWVDACELSIAAGCGWPVAVRAGMTYAEGNRPADTFGEKMVRLREHARQHPAGDLVAAGLRSMFIRTVGAWHSRGRERTHVVPLGQDLPAGVTEWETRADGSRVYVQRVALTGNAAAFMRPELSAQVWARARARVARRMLDTGGGLYPDDVVAVWGDALYLNGEARDQGERVGTFRVKAYLPGGIIRPKSISDLLKIRARMGDG